MINREIEVIKMLIAKRGQDLNIRQLSKELRMDYKNTHNIVKRLATKSILRLERFGKSQKVILINKSSQLMREAEYARQREVLQNKTIAVMLDYFKGISSCFYVLLLFGSYAKGISRKCSDIDLLFIVPNADEGILQKEIHNVARTIPLDLHIHVFKEEDFKLMMKSKEMTVGSEAASHNIILHGIEQYYEMIQ